MQLQSVSQVSSVGSIQLNPGEGGAVRAQVAAAESSQIAEAVKVSPDAIQAAHAAPDPKEVKNAVEKLNKSVELSSRSLQFSVDEDTRINIVKLIDTDSKQVLRQIPSEEILSIAKAIDKLQGLLIQDKA